MIKDNLKVELLNKLKELSKENNISLNDMSRLLGNESKKEQEEQLRDKVNDNKDLVGRYFYRLGHPRSKMFPEMKKFYRVLSNRSENEYRVECLTFYEHPTYWFDYNAHKIGFPGDYYLGNFEFESFVVDSFMAKDIRSLTEISKEEFDSYAKKYLDELLNLEWLEDHYRWGGVLPKDEKWKIHDLDEVIKIEKDNK